MSDCGSDGPRPCGYAAAMTSPTERRVDGALERRIGHRPAVFKLIKYSAASAAGVVTGVTVLNTCLLVLDLGAVTSNIIGVTAGSIPNYLINRAWTFNKRDTHSFTREILPFWLMAVLGLIISTFAVAWADDRWDGNALALNAANLGSFGVLWVAKFFVLERVLFKPLAHVIEHELEHDQR
jgi:putative flippase GtrA